MPPKHLVLDGFLGEQASIALLQSVLNGDRAAASARVVSDDGLSIDHSRRKAGSVPIDWETEGKPFRETVKARSTELFQGAGITPFSPLLFELECVVHRDGGHFEHHIDTFTGAHVQESDRILSAVYYFFRQPRAFSGGQLALYPLGDGDPVPIEPVHDRLVAFPSFVPHEVREVSVPGDRFADARFSINCWLRRRRS